MAEDEKKDNDIKMINNFNQTWELLKTCVDFLEENEPKWKKGQSDRMKERERKEKIAKAARLSKESKKRHVQNKITEHFNKLPRKEKERIEMEEIVEKRLELQKIKKELWKHRGKGKKVARTAEKGELGK